MFAMILSLAIQQGNNNFPSALEHRAAQAHANAQGLNVTTAAVGTSGGGKVEVSKPGWQKLVPWRKGYSNPKLGKLLSDVESMMPSGHQYAHPDNLSTWCHETSHGVNSRARQALPKRWNAFYVFNGRCFVIPEPNVTKKQVARFIPKHLRRDVFNLYVIEPTPPPGFETWDLLPLHLVDELSCYINGLECGTELQQQQDAVSDLQHGLELAGYCSALVRCIEANDKPYTEKYLPYLVEFLNYNFDRLAFYLKRHADCPKCVEIARLVKETFNAQDSIGANSVVGVR
jgi:hypothetical protein